MKRDAPLVSVEEAQRLAMAPAAKLGAERVALTAALGRVLAEAIVAPGDVPPHDNSAMDGYAVRSADTNAPGARLHVVGEAAAGRVLSRALAAGEAYRIFTGAPLPPGADAVVMQEDATTDGEFVTLAVAAAPRKHVRDRGEDVRAGDVVLQPGCTLRAAELGTLASARRAMVAVTRRPRVAILSTGDELRDVDQPLDPGAIAETNSYALAALCRDAGAEPRILPLVRDEPSAIAAAIAEARDASDFIVTTGGVSVGARDHVKPVLQQLGATLTAWRVDMKPGKPVALAVIGTTPFYGLPGNPVSAMVAFTLFVRPALRVALGCARPLDGERATARLDAPLVTKSERRQFLRARLSFDVTGALRAAPMAKQGSGVLTSMLAANGFIDLAAGEHALAKDDAVTALIIGPLGCD
jgi:molybdopterin molybdotransferase